MSPLRAVFKKELIDTLRDRRTLIAMIFVPLLLTPALMVGMTRYMASQAEAAATKVLKVAVVEPTTTSRVADHLAKDPGLAVEHTKDVSQLPARIRDESLDAAVVVDPTFYSNIAGNKPGGVTLMFRSSQDFNISQRRVEADLKLLEQEILAERFAAARLDPDFIHGVSVDLHDISSKRENGGKLIGGLLPYLFIIFCFTGSMYPAIDLAAGEKERGTLETLLTAPVHRRTLVLGKFLIVALAGVVSALIAVVGLVVVAKQGIRGVPDDVVAAVAESLSPLAVAAVLALLVPLSSFFAAVLLMLSVYARSYKEAMSIVSPLMIVVLLPAMLALMPGTKLTVVTALVPVLNVSLATRELLSGRAEPALVALSFVSLVVLAGASLVACTRWFAREDIVFRA
jgi:sodium transport system permease protein